MDNSTQNPFDWKTAIQETYEKVFYNIVEFAPQFVGALALLVVGWLVARFLRIITRKTISRLDALFQKVTYGSSIHQEKLKESYALIIGQVVFWTVIIFFVSASINLAGWNLFSGWMNNIVAFLPSLVTGLLIILSGFLLGNAIRSITSTAGQNARIPQADILARLAQGFIFFSAIVIGIEQIGIHTQFLTTALIVIIGVLLAGACLAFGLGAKTVVSNIIGTQYIRKQCQVGDHIRIQDYEGDVLEIQDTCLILDTGNGKAVIPAHLFQEQVSVIQIVEASPSDGSPDKSGGTP